MGDVSDSKSDKKERVRCDVCRTINLAKHVKHPKPDMQMYEKCTPVEKYSCPRVAGITNLLLCATPKSSAICWKLAFAC